MAGRKMSPKRVQEMAQERVSNAFRASCSGIQIDIMDMSKITAVGLAAIAEGVDDIELQRRIKEFVETIRKN